GQTRGARAHPDGVCARAAARWAARLAAAPPSPRGCPQATGWPDSCTSRPTLPEVDYLVLELPRRAPNPTAPNSPRPCVLVVEDDESLRTLLAHYLGREGYPVEVAADGAAALRALEERRARGD